MEDDCIYNDKECPRECNIDFKGTEDEVTFLRCLWATRVDLGYLCGLEETYNHWLKHCGRIKNKNSDDIIKNAINKNKDIFEINGDDIELTAKALKLLPKEKSKLMLKAEFNKVKESYAVVSKEYVDLVSRNPTFNLQAIVDEVKNEEQVFNRIQDLIDTCGCDDAKENIKEIKELIKKLNKQLDDLQTIIDKWMDILTRVLEKQKTKKSCDMFDEVMKCLNRAKSYLECVRLENAKSELYNAENLLKEIEKVNVESGRYLPDVKTRVSEDGKEVIQHKQKLNSYIVNTGTEEIPQWVLRKDPKIAPAYPEEYHRSRGSKNIGYDDEIEITSQFSAPKPMKQIEEINVESGRYLPDVKTGVSKDGKEPQSNENNTATAYPHQKETKFNDHEAKAIKELVDNNKEQFSPELLDKVNRLFDRIFRSLEDGNLTDASRYMELLKQKLNSYIVNTGTEEIPQWVLRNDPKIAPEYPEEYHRSRGSKNIDYDDEIEITSQSNDPKPINQRYVCKTTLSYWEYFYGILRCNRNMLGLFPKPLNNLGVIQIHLYDNNDCYYGKIAVNFAKKRLGNNYCNIAKFTRQLIPGAIIYLQRRNKGTELEYVISYDKVDPPQKTPILDLNDNGEFVINERIVHCRVDNHLTLLESRWQNIVGLKIYDEEHQETGAYITQLAFKLIGNKDGNRYSATLDEIIKTVSVLKPFSKRYLLNILSGKVYTRFYRSKENPNIYICDLEQSNIKIKRVTPSSKSCTINEKTKGPYDKLLEDLSELSKKASKIWERTKELYDGQR